MADKQSKITATNSAGYTAPVGLAADPVIFTVADNQLKVLLVWRGTANEGNWALPGGFVGETESPEETAHRKLTEKTGVKAGYLEQLRTYGDPDRDPRGWIPSIAFLALIPADALDVTSDVAAEHKADWIPVSGALRNFDLAFDHKQIIRDALERLRGKLWYSNIAVGLLPREFTLGEARRIYEAILGEPLDPANFARDLKASGLVKPTGKTRSTGRGRPGQAFAFVSRKPAWSPTRDKGRRG